MSKDKDSRPGIDAKESLSVAEYKAMLEKGVPIELVRRAKRLFCVRHFSADALDNEETAEPDALYYSNFMWEFLPSAVVPASKTRFDLPRELTPKWEHITCSDVNGKPHPTLKEFIDLPASKLQALMIIHKGKVVYETYPGMRPADLHIWMSNTKPLVGTLVLDLIMNGKMDPKAAITRYVPELNGSAWDDVPVQAVLTMTAGLNADDMAGNMFVAGSMEQRYYQASFGELYNGQKENWVEVIRACLKMAEAVGGL